MRRLPQASVIGGNSGGSLASRYTEHAISTFTSTRNLDATPAAVFADAAVAAAIRHIVAPANEQNLDRLGAEVSQGMTASG